MRAPVARQFVDRIEAIEDGLFTPQRPPQPAPQRSSPHRRTGTVHHTPQRGPWPGGVTGIEDLQIFQRGRIQEEVIVVVIAAQTSDVIHGFLMTRDRIGQRSSRGSGAHVRLLHSESAQGLRRELASQ